MKVREIALALGLASAALAGNAYAADHEVKMLNKGTAGNMVFEPAVLKIAPGDTVTFRAVDKGHNAQTLDVLLPSGASKFQGKVNEEVTVAFDQPGVYGYECKPHSGFGMMGMVVVGDASANLAQVKETKFKGMQKQRFEAMLKQLGE